MLFLDLSPEFRHLDLKRVQTGMQSGQTAPAASLTFPGTENGLLHPLDPLIQLLDLLLQHLNVLLQQRAFLGGDTPPPSQHRHKTHNPQHSAQIHPVYHRLPALRPD